MSATGRRPSECCTASGSYPRLDKTQELLAMDAQALALGRKWWQMWQRHKGRQAAAPATPPLAIELPPLRADD